MVATARGGLRKYLSKLYSRRGMLSFNGVKRSYVDRRVFCEGKDARRSRLFTSISVSKPVQKDTLDKNDWTAALNDLYSQPVCVSLEQRHQRIYMKLTPVKKTVFPDSVYAFLRRWNQEEIVWEMLHSAERALPLTLSLGIPFFCKDPSNR